MPTRRLPLAIAAVTLAVATRAAGGSMSLPALKPRGMLVLTPQKK